MSSTLNDKSPRGVEHDHVECGHCPGVQGGEKADLQSIYLEKTESRLDDSIKDPTKDPEFTKSCLQAYKNIIATGGCNECAIRAMCNKRPDWGKLVRYNCIYFRRENNE